jgi:toxin secretion/phage lysis holin
MNKDKTIFTTVLSAVFSCLGILAIPVALMIVSNIFDYITGLIATKFRNQKVTSYKSIRGIYKKVCMWLLVGVGAMIDALIKYASDQVGISFHLNFLVASIVAVWIICNEIISILENVVDIGVNIPPFLLPLVNSIKDQTEKKVEAETVVKESEENNG